jgi:ADP-ribose pyrophosphatase YjhB (NUDIX family)
MRVFNLQQIRQTMASHAPEFVVAHASTRQAAVAIILRPTKTLCDVLFIQRAEKPGDPWSGQMAFPGGHLELQDAGLKGAAMRETHEEIGLDISNAEYLGALSHQRAQPRGRSLNMLIAPHVFVVEGDPQFKPNYEVAEVVWAPMEQLLANSLHDTQSYAIGNRPTICNGYRLERGHFVWGLTYRMLKSFFSTLDNQWQPPTEVAEAAPD